MRHLISQLMDEELLNSLYLSETASEFIERIHVLLMDEFNHLQNYAPLEISHEIKNEIINEVTEVYRIKTYGFYNLTNFKKALKTRKNEPTL